MTSISPVLRSSVLAALALLGAGLAPSSIRAQLGTDLCSEPEPFNVGDGDCACRSFKQVLACKDVPNPAPAERDYEKGFWSALHTNRCVQRGIMLPVGELQGDSWCYVSSKCTSLNGGEKVSNSTSWKICSRGEDALMGDLAPQEVFKLAKSIPWDLGFVISNAYKQSTLTWDKVAWFFRNETLPSDDERLPMKVYLEALVGTGRPAVFEEIGNGSADQWVVQGSQIWDINDAPYVEHLRAFPVCVAGCPAGEPSLPNRLYAGSSPAQLQETKADLNLNLKGESAPFAYSAAPRSPWLGLALLCAAASSHVAGKL